MLNPSATQFLKKLDDASKYIPHHMLLSQNLKNGDGSCSKLFYNEIPYHSSSPLPISNYSPHVVDDNFVKLITEKDQWHQNMRSLKTLHRDLPGHLKLQEIQYSACSTTNVPWYILKYAKLLKQDPDKNFDSHFNWYMSGVGNLCLSSVTEPSHVYTAVGNELYLYYFDGCTVTELDYNFKYVCENEEPIYEIIKCQEMEKNIVVVRQKNKFHLVKYRGDHKQQQLDPVAIHNSGSSLTCLIFDKSDNIVYTDVKGDIYHYDVETKSTSIFSEIMHASNTLNNWNSLVDFSNHALMKIDRNTLHMLDKRQKYAALSMLPSFKDNCDYIVSAQLGTNPCHIYLGTLHQLYQFDIRFFKHNNPSMKRWTHGLKSPPVFIKNCLFDTSELIVLGSQLSDEMCVVSNHLDTNFHNKIDFDIFEDLPSVNETKTNHDVSYLPKMLPNIMDSYNCSRRKGFCLDPTINLKAVLNLSRSGLNYYQTEKAIDILSLNAAGEVFSQKLTIDYLELFSKNDCANMELWSKKFKRTRFPFTITSRTNMTFLKNAMKRSSNRPIQGRRSKGYISENKYWKKSLKDLNNYSDMWANEMLSIWDVSETKPGIDHLVPPVDTKFKINTWIDQLPLDED